LEERFTSINHSFGGSFLGRASSDLKDEKEDVS
jgi:hypothetical protein